MLSSKGRPGLCSDAGTAQGCVQLKQRIGEGRAVSSCMGLGRRVVFSN